MIVFCQILHDETGCTSDLFGCLSPRRLVVVDPHEAHVEDYPLQRITIRLAGWRAHEKRRGSR